MGKKIKTAYVVEYPTPYDIPLFERIAKRPEIDFTALFLSGTIGERGWKVDPTGRFNHKFVKGRRMFISANTQFTAFWNPGIFSEIERGGYDVVGTSGYIPVTHYAVLAWCKRKGIPYFVRSEAVLPLRRSPVKRFLKRLYLPFVVRNAGAWLAAGTLAKEYLAYYGADPDRTFFLNYTVDDDAFELKAIEARSRRDEIRRELGITAKRVILYSGRFAAMKDLHTLLSAFKIVKNNGSNAALALLGSGPLEAELKQRAAAENIRDVHFLGFHQSDELPKYYGIADLFVLPSIYEPWGIVVNEAQAAHLPVIASDLCGAAADLVVDGKTGFRFRAGDAGDLARCIEQIINSDKLIEEMGLAGRELVRDWGLDRSVNGFIQAAQTANYGDTLLNSGNKAD